MASKVLQETERETVQIVDVVHVGDKIMLPESMTKREAVKNIIAAEKYESEIVEVRETIDAFPWDGAVAFKWAMDQVFGHVFAQPTYSFFGKNPPREINIAVDAHGGKVVVPWGKFAFPGGTDEEWLATATDVKDGRLVLAIVSNVTRAHKPAIHQLAKLTRERLVTNSIYRSKAVRIKFRDDDGDTIGIPEPVFLDLSRTNPDNLVFRDDLMRMIETNVWTPLRYREACAEAGVPFKRGVLLAGPYGTGKTLAAFNTALEATNNGVTFLYLQDVRELPDAIRFVQRYSPAVIFAEDVDRATSGERDIALDTILNTLDGVDSKSSEVMVVLTTNHLERINKAMLRPGRLDVVLNVLPPDAVAARKLIRQYGFEQLDLDAKLIEVGELLDGQIPAVIREVVERSKLERIRRAGSAKASITDDDLVIAAKTVLQQQELFREKPAEVTTLDGQLRRLVQESVNEPNTLMPTRKEVRRIAERLEV